MIIVIKYRVIIVIIVICKISGSHPPNWYEIFNKGAEPPELLTRGAAEPPFFYTPGFICSMFL
jgi:hypothetical protein